MQNLLNRLTSPFQETMTDLHKELTGTPSKVSQLDLDISSDVEEERAALEEARTRRDEIQSELDQLHEALDFRREAANRAETLTAVIGNGYASDLEDSEQEIEEIEAAIHQKRGELKEVRAETAEAAQALREAQEQAQKRVREQAAEIRDDAMQRMDEALNEAQAANLELYLLTGVQRELPFSLKLVISFDRSLIPAPIDPGASLLQRIHKNRTNSGLNSNLQSHPDPEAFQEWRDEILFEARAVAPLEPPVDEEEPIVA